MLCFNSIGLAIHEIGREEAISELGAAFVHSEQQTRTNGHFEKVLSYVSR